MGPGVAQSLPGGITDVDLGPRPWTYLVEGSACLLSWKPCAQVPGDDGQRVLLALAGLPNLWACWVSQVALPAAGNLVFSHFIKISI